MTRIREIEIYMNKVTRCMWPHVTLHISKNYGTIDTVDPINSATDENFARAIEMQHRCQRYEKQETNACAQGVTGVWKGDDVAVGKLQYELMFIP